MESLDNGPAQLDPQTKIALQAERLKTEGWINTAVVTRAGLADAIGDLHSKGLPVLGIVDADGCYQVFTHPELAVQPADDSEAALVG